MSRPTQIFHDGSKAGGSAGSAEEIAAAAAKWFAIRDAGASREQEAEFQRWLAAEPRHALAFARVDAAWSSFGKPVRAGRADDLLTELAARSRRRRQTRAKTVAAALVMLAMGGALWRFARPAQRPAAQASETATWLVPRQQTLPDGSVVTLNRGAEISVAFSADRRRVFLQQGEAHFQVAKNPKRPFLVLANGVEVRAVGTAFSVQRESTAVAVLVAEGTVAVGKSAAMGAQDPAEPDASPVTPALSAVSSGNRVVVEVSTTAPAPEVVPVDAAEMGERLAWLNPRMEFTGTPLAEAVALINREAKRNSGVELVLGDPELGKVRVSGIFRTDNLDAFVLLLENGGFNIKAERSARAIILRQTP